MKIKALLYCTKAKPYLYKTEKPMIEKKFGDYHTQLNKAVLTENLNGKIVAECDYEVEKIEYDWYPCNILPAGEHYYTYYHTKSISTAKEFYSKSCLDWDKLNQYLNDYDSQKFDGGYAIHIKNLHIFDKPRELEFYSSKFDNFKKLEKAPQNMMKVWEDKENPKVLISIRPEWLCKILNGEKKIEVRKKVLKEMLRNE